MTKSGALVGSDLKALILQENDQNIRAPDLAALRSVGLSTNADFLLGGRLRRLIRKRACAARAAMRPVAPRSP
jgi:hypothetical protein